MSSCLSVLYTGMDESAKWSSITLGIHVWPLCRCPPPTTTASFSPSSSRIILCNTHTTYIDCWLDGWLTGWKLPRDGEGVAWEEVEKHRMNGFNHNNDIGYYSPPYKGSAVNGRKQDKSLLYSLICDRHEMERWSSSSRRKSTILACTVFAQIIFDSI